MEQNKVGVSPFLTKEGWNWAKYLNTEAPMVARASLVRWSLSPVLTCTTNVNYTLQKKKGSVLSPMITLILFCEAKIKIPQDLKGL